MKGTLVVAVGLFVTACSAPTEPVPEAPEKTPTPSAALVLGGYSATVLQLDEGFAMSEAGTVVGRLGPFPAWATAHNAASGYLARYDAGSHVATAIASNGIVVGYSQNGPTRTQLMWSSVYSLPTVMAFPAGFSSIRPRDVNSQGVVVGDALQSGGAFVNFRWSAADGFRVVSSSRAGSRGPYITDSGFIAGEADEGAAHAFRDAPSGERTYFRLDSYLHQLNEDGSVVVTEWRPQPTKTWFWNPALEPPFNALPIWATKRSARGRVAGRWFTELLTAFGSGQGALPFPSWLAIDNAYTEVIGITSCGTVVAKVRTTTGITATLAWRKGICDRIFVDILPTNGGVVAR